MQKNPGILTKAVKGNPSGSDLVFGAGLLNEAPIAAFLFIPVLALLFQKAITWFPVQFQRCYCLSGQRFARVSRHRFRTGDDWAFPVWKNADLTAVKSGHRLKSTWIQWARKEADGRKMIRPSFHRVEWLLKRPLSWFVLFFVHWCQNYDHLMHKQS